MLTNSSLSCCACGAVPPPGATLIYINGWPYCPRCVPK